MQVEAFLSTEFALGTGVFQMAELASRTLHATSIEGMDAGRPAQKWMPIAAARHSSRPILMVTHTTCNSFNLYSICGICIQTPNMLAFESFVLSIFITEAVHTQPLKRFQLDKVGHGSTHLRILISFWTSPLGC